MIEGRDSNSVDFYQAKAERLVHVAITITLLVSLVPLLYSLPASKLKAVLEPLDRTNEALTFLGLLVITDLFFIVLHCLRAKFGLPSDWLFSIESDGGYAEVFQYLKEGWITLLLLHVTFRRRSALHFAWSLLFAYLLIDDSLTVHERIGVAVAKYFEFVPAFGLRAEDFGELSVSAVSAATLLILIGAAHYRADPASKQFSKHLFFLLISLAFFGVAADMVHMLFFSWDFFLALVEDGGEMLVMSIITWFVLSSTHRDQTVPGLAQST